MSKASVVAAKICIELQTNEQFIDLFTRSNEPYRAVIDAARDAEMHDIVDGSEEYEQLVDLIEHFKCKQGLTFTSAPVILTTLQQRSAKWNFK